MDYTSFLDFFPGLKLMCLVVRPPLFLLNLIYHKFLMMSIFILKFPIYLYYCLNFQIIYVVKIRTWKGGPSESIPIPESPDHISKKIL